MKVLPLMIVFVLISRMLWAQSFLKAYKTFRLEKVSTIPDPHRKRMLQKFVISQIIELDTIFQAYQARTNFDFNSADSIFLIYESPAESPFTSDILIWSGKHSISFSQEIVEVKPNIFGRTIKYAPFLPLMEIIRGFRIITERDSLIRLVAKRDYETINHLGDNQSINDGSFINIYVAYKNKGEYKMESCSPNKFFFQTRF